MAKIVLVIGLVALMSLITPAITQTHRRLSKDELKISRELFKELIMNDYETSDSRINFPTAITEKLESLKNFRKFTMKLPVPTYNDRPIDYSCVRSDESYSFFF
ncbi:hypothetical protein KQX54_010547 [Cotesia glomerata]|uniref:Uncharacterized protein n=1 Tax=Cotesia glomerata TaxID=32391 RepID=A0AAV7IMQ3_COTGL|nr:hypothetical protein KQX54_010547 [Cotesia glomerata]